MENNLNKDTFTVWVTDAEDINSLDGVNSNVVRYINMEPDGAKALIEQSLKQGFLCVVAKE